MPGVPQYGDPRVNPSGPNDTTFQTPDTAGFAQSGQQLERMGQTIEQGGQQMGRIYQAAQEKANDLRVIDAENAAREAAIKLTVDNQEGYAHIKGGDVMNVDGKPLAETYRAKYQQQLSDIMGGLSNDAQRMAFRQSAAQLSTQFYTQAKEHETSQYQNWQESVVKGSADLAGQEISLNYSDPNFIDGRLRTLDVSVEKLGTLKGMAGNEIAALQNTATSQALSQAIKTAIDAGDTTTGRSLFNRYQDKLLGPDRSAIEPTLKREEALAVGQSYGEDYVSQLLKGSAIGGVPPINAAPGGKLDPMAAWAFTSQHEGSAYVAHDANGAPVRFGVNQAANPGVDVKNLTESQAGQIFVNKYWKPSGAANLPAPLAAMQADTYFINPAAANRFLKQSGGDPAKYMQLRTAWMNHMVASEPGKFGKFEKAWSSRNRDLSAFSAQLGGGVSTTTGRPEMTAEDAVSAAATRLFADHPDATPEMRQQVEEAAKNTWELHHNSVNQADDQATSGAMTQLMQNGGNISALSPQVRNAIPGAKWDSVVAFARSVQAYGKEKRDPAHDDALYNQAVTDPIGLKNMNDSDFLHTFAGMARFDDVAKYRAQLQGKMVLGKKDTSGDLNYATINRVVDTRLQSIGVDPNDKNQVGHVGAVRRVLNGAIAGEQRRLGRQLTDAETESFVDRQFARPGVIHSSGLLGGFAKSNIPLFGVDVSEIPTDDLKQIDDALDRVGQPKTDANRLSLYYAGRAR